MAENGLQEADKRAADALEVADVNHYDSRVFVQFVGGHTVVLTGQEILDAVSRRECPGDATLPRLPS